MKIKTGRLILEPTVETRSVTGNEYIMSNKETLSLIKNNSK